MARQGRAMRCWRPAPEALLGQGLTSLGAPVGSWDLGRVGGILGRLSRYKKAILSLIWSSLFVNLIFFKINVLIIIPLAKYHLAHFH